MVAIDGRGAAGGHFMTRRFDRLSERWWQAAYAVPGTRSPTSISTPPALTPTSKLCDVIKRLGLSMHARERTVFVGMIVNVVGGRNQDDHVKNVHSFDGQGGLLVTFTRV